MISLACDSDGTCGQGTLVDGSASPRSLTVAAKLFEMVRSILLTSA